MSESFEDFLARKERRLNGEPKPKKIPKPLKKTRLNPVSKKQKKRIKAYAKAREEHYSNADNQVCALCGRDSNLSIHHTKKRGASISDASTFVSLCIIGDVFRSLHPELNLNAGSGGCHGIVEANKSWARSKGLLE